MTFYLQDSKFFCKDATGLPRKHIDAVKLEAFTPEGMLQMWILLGTSDADIVELLPTLVERWVHREDATVVRRHAVPMVDR